MMRRVVKIALSVLLFAVVFAPAVVVAQEEDDGERAEAVRAAPPAPSRPPPPAPSRPPVAPTRRVKKVVATNKPGRSWKSSACKMPETKSGMRKLRLTEPLAVASFASLAVGLATGALIPTLLLAPAFAASAFLEVKAAQYEKLVEDNTINVDEYTCQSPGFLSRAKVQSHPRSLAGGGRSSNWMLPKINLFRPHTFPQFASKNCTRVGIREVEAPVLGVQGLSCRSHALFQGVQV